ncbi:MAG: hypothetical protein QOD10_5579 [Mycobacterium sp.]|nr:hypothetical protein [Mycobacterium sp.]
MGGTRSADTRPKGRGMITVRRQVIRALPALMMVAGLTFTGCATGHTRPSAAAPSSSPVASAPAGATGAGGPALLLGEVKRELAAMKETHYQHTTSVDEAIGKFFYDCSGMVDYALGRVLPDDAKALPTSTLKRPLAGDIELFLHDAVAQPVPGWQALTRVDQLGPGDLVAWQATEDSTTGDTGHVMVVLAAPAPNPGRNGEWVVQVADSTVSPHALDSRHRSQTGLGTGTIGLAVDGNGAPVGFYWQGGVSKNSRSTEIALGRPL